MINTAGDLGNDEEITSFPSNAFRQQSSFHIWQTEKEAESRYISLVAATAFLLFLYWACLQPVCEQVDLGHS